MSTATAPTARSGQARKAVAFPRKTHYKDPRQTSRSFTIFCVVVLSLLAVIWVAPVIFAALTSLRPDGNINASPINIFDGHYSFSAYSHVVNATSIWSWYLNSFVISILTVVFTVALCSMAGFALARTRFKGRAAVSGVILAGLMIPGQVLILPLFSEFRVVGLLNSYWPIVLVGIPAPVAVFVFASFLSGIPDSLIESARLDGAGWWRVYWNICMPLCRPAVAAVAIFTFVSSWNNFLWPLLVLSNTEQMTIPVGLATVVGGFGIQYAEVMATAVLGLLPLLVVFLLFQRQIVQGVASTGIK